MKNNSKIKDILSWFFGILFLIIGILNIILVHSVPGLIYILISFIFYPPVNVLLKKKIGFSIFFPMKLILFFLIMWPTLGVSDLGEKLGL